MAEDSNKEQLEIQAKLDTSQLKREAKQGLNDVVKEEKKVEQQSKQTSKSIDEIGQKGKTVGNELQNAGQTGTQALKQVGQEADKTAKKIDEIAKATKNIGLKQGLGMASHALTQLAPIGQAAGSALGMSDSDISLAGGALNGAASGAMFGSTFGPIGAAAGALIGAGAGLLTASQELNKAAESLIDNSKKGWEETVAAWKKREEDTRNQNAWNETVKGYANNLSQDDHSAVIETQEAIKAKIAELVAEDEGITQKILENEQKIRDSEKWFEEHKDKMSSEFRAERLSSIYKWGEEITNMSGDKQPLIRSKIAQLQAMLDASIKAMTDTSGFTGPQIPEHIKAQQDAFVGPELPPEIKAQRDAEAAWEKMKDMNWKSQLQDALKENDSIIRDRESFMGKMSGLKLTDSMVQIGAGGYGVQMQGINSYVKNMSSSLETMRKVSQDILSTIKSIENKYSPYGGQFIAEQ